MATENDDLSPERGYPTVQIRIQEKGDPLADQIIGVQDNERVVFISPEVVFIKKRAMQSGKSSVTIYAKTKQGEHIFFETSGAMLKMISELVVGIDGLQL